MYILPDSYRVLFKHVFVGEVQWQCLHHNDMNFQGRMLMVLIFLLLCLMLTLCSYFLRSKYTEVLFPNEFISIHPWGGIPPPAQRPVMLSDERNYAVPPVVIPMSNLMHVTHNAEAQQITSVENNIMFNFQAAPKLGKVLGAYDGRPCGESFKSNPDHTSFAYISPDKAVFPGSYSWWSIYSATDDSRYGNNAFVCDFLHLLTSYATSRQVDLRKICIRKGGTLRYKQEICYVLIICHEADGDLIGGGFGALELMPNKFQTNGLIDGCGRICNISATPTFLQQQYSDGSHEIAAVAFYFPTENAHLSVPVYYNTPYQPAVHHVIPHTYCIKKHPPRRFAPFVCPNELPTLPTMQTMSQTHSIAWTIIAMPCLHLYLPCW